MIAACLGACGALAYYTPDVARTYFTEAVDLARQSGNRSMLCHILSYLACCDQCRRGAIDVAVAAEEGRDVADTIGDDFTSRIVGSGRAFRWLPG